MKIPSKLKNKSKYIYLILLILFFDQLTKYLVVSNNFNIINKNLIVFTIDFVTNNGAAFNILSGNMSLLISISIIASILLSYLVLIKRDINRGDRYAFSFLLAGSIGNGIDRILNGYVIDFINLNFLSFPVFNIADISINIGFIILVFNLLRYKE